MRINLLEIPVDGKTFVLNRHTSELNKTLTDIIADFDYSIEFTIRPLETGYSLQGNVSTKAPENCSRCGEDYTQDIIAKYSEILMPRLELNRTDHYAKPNHYSDLTSEGETSIVEYDGHHFEAGEYLHEIIALQLSTTPAPKVDCDGNCVLCHEKVTGRTFGFTEEFPEVKQSPFAALKNLKIN